MSASNISEEWAAKLKIVEKGSDGSVKTRIIRRTSSDFKIEGELGEGSYSNVMLARDIHTEKLYAIKVLDKRHIVKEKKVKYVNIEKDSLNILGRRNGIVHLFFTFQDERSLYFVLDYASNGELLSLIKKYGTLNEDVTRYYAAQILDALKYMHSRGVIHRDLKPENILLDDGFRIQVTDFGTAKLLSKDPETDKYIDDGKAKSFVGTAEYVSPELLNDKAVGKPCDIWALGCIVYQMIAGRPPFKATNDYLTFQQVMKLKYAFSAGFPTIIRDLVKRILVLVPEDRPTIKELEKHLFFQGIDWRDTENSVWYSPPPEFSPYKVSAQAMKPVPELGAAPKIRIPLKSRKSELSGSNKSLAATPPSQSISSSSSGNNSNNNSTISVNKFNRSTSTTNVINSSNNINVNGNNININGNGNSNAAVGSTSANAENLRKGKKQPIKNLSANAAAIALTKISISGESGLSSKSKTKTRLPKDHRRQHSSSSIHVRTGRGTDLRMKYHDEENDDNNNSTAGLAEPVRPRKNKRSISLPSSPQVGTGPSPENTPKQEKPEKPHSPRLNHYSFHPSHFGTQKAVVKSTASPSLSPSLSSPPVRAKTLDYTPLDLEWHRFFINSHERVLKSGVLYIRYMTTESFEKKFKGKLANSPLYYKGKRNSNGTFNYSLLTQMVHGNGRSGLRNGKNSNNSTNSSNNHNHDGTYGDGAGANDKEISGIVHYVKTGDIEEIEAELDNNAVQSGGPNVASTNGGSSNTGKGMFKRILSTTKSVMNNSNNFISNATSNGVPEFRSSRMILVTTLGRLLILGRKPGVDPQSLDNFAKYELITEIDLTHPSIRVKEIITDQSFLKSGSTASSGPTVISSPSSPLVLSSATANSPPTSPSAMTAATATGAIAAAGTAGITGTTASSSAALSPPSSPVVFPPASAFLGIFTIITYSTTTLFQVDKSSLNRWTEAITEARLSGQDYKLRRIVEKDPSGGAGMLTGTEAALAAASLANNEFR